MEMMVKTRLGRAAVKADAGLDRAKVADGVANAAQIDAQTLVRLLVLFRLPQHVDIKARAGDIEKIEVVHAPDVYARKRRVQLRALGLDGIFGQSHCCDKFIARAAAGKQQGKLAAGHAVDDLKKRAVAADGDDARHAIRGGLTGIGARLSGAVGYKCAVGDAFAAQQRFDLRKFALAAPVSRDGVDDQCIHRPPHTRLRVRVLSAPALPRQGRTFVNILTDICAFCQVSVAVICTSTSNSASAKRSAQT